MASKRARDSKAALTAAKRARAAKGAAKPLKARKRITTVRKAPAAAKKTNKESKKADNMETCLRVMRRVNARCKSLEEMIAAMRRDEAARNAI